MMSILFANLPTALCLLLGAGLMIAEVFLPGFGLPGISGLVLIGVGVVLTSAHFGLTAAVAVLLVVVAVLAVLITFLLRQASNGGMKRSRLFLNQKEELHDKTDMQILVSKKGETLSVLRPAGIGDFDGVRLNVVTEGGFIDKGQPVEIVRVEGSRIVVRQRAEA